MHAHTLGQLLAAGVKVTLNSDDPAYFGGYLNDNIRAVLSWSGFFEYPDRESAMRRIGVLYPSAMMK
jgi:adenosine deaminase